MKRVFELKGKNKRFLRVRKAFGELTGRKKSGRWQSFSARNTIPEDKEV
jgi:hypothetical protein